MAGVSLVVMRKGTILYEGNLGDADVAKNVATETNTRYRLYSTAKSLTAAAAMRMAELGLLDLDEAISTVMPDLPAHVANITPRQLMANRSGIRNYESGEWIEVSSTTCKRPIEALAPFIDDPLIFAPGTENAYTTFGYVLLSAVMEAAYAGSFESAMSDLVFKPAKMDGIAVEGRDTNGYPLAQSYLYQEEEEPEFFPLDQYDPPVLVSCKFGGGGFVGRALDLARFGDSLASEYLVSDAGRDQLWSNLSVTEGFPSYGLGFFDGDRWLASLDAEQRAEGDEVPDRVFPEAWFHGGSAAGGYSMLFIYPDHDLVLAMAATNRAMDNFIMLDYHEIAAEFFYSIQ
jgi:CubicO group peptidase (beta-lactamase class C family)